MRKAVRVPRLKLGHCLCVFQHVSFLLAQVSRFSHLEMQSVEHLPVKGRLKALASGPAVPVFPAAYSGAVVCERFELHERRKGQRV